MKTVSRASIEQFLHRYHPPKVEDRMFDFQLSSILKDIGYHRYAMTDNGVPLYTIDPHKYDPFVLSGPFYLHDIPVSTIGYFKTIEKLQYGKWVEENRTASGVWLSPKMQYHLPSVPFYRIEALVSFSEFGGRKHWIDFDKVKCRIHRKPKYYETCCWPAKFRMRKLGINANHYRIGLYWGHWRLCWVYHPDPELQHQPALVHCAAQARNQP